MTLRRRCAIYTRKSTEEGLEQGFNSLHAQREACEAFIKSQQHEGWRALPEAFDDGGYSGATTERPALTRLLELVRARKIDTIVVYKVDRLTRSLADFARMVELFDANEVSFVSVTQQFNTTTSMGRLTLNVLLSFAQFEREVTGERIRDKIAASRQKGLWMGGSVPLGYDIRDRALVINEAEAETVRTLFRLYRELGTVRRLKEAADQLGLRTKRRPLSSGGFTGSGPFTRGHLYCLLANPTYVGDAAHKGNRYPGQHSAIIDRETFDVVQRQLKENASTRYSASNVKEPSLLTGLVYDETGDRLCPTHANKRGRRYRYYISKRLMHRAGPAVTGWRLPARELENVVILAVAELLCDERQIVEALGLDSPAPDLLLGITERAPAAAAELRDGAPGLQRQLLATLLSRITLQPGAVRTEVNRLALARLLDLEVERDNQSDGPFEIRATIKLRRRGVETKLVMQAPSQSPEPDTKLIAVLANAVTWVDDLAHGRAASVRDLAQRHERDPGEVSRTLPLAFLAPRIVEAVVEGRQPLHLTPRHLMRIRFLSRDWEEQRRGLGFSTEGRYQ